jgi:peptidoglycan/LPS O-acetylase OafA/YrhL
LVIAAGVGAATARLAPGPLLAVAPLRCVGDRSYAFYLWHWPVLVIAAEYEGRALSLNARLVLLAIAFLLSIVSYRRVEDPIRRSRCGGQATALLWPVSVGAVVMVATLAIQASDAESLHLANAAASVGA